MEFKVYGCRGSSPMPKKEFLGFGGNTSSYTLRTADNTLIFLDAGTGIQYAQKELDKHSDDIALLFSHMHADHIMGLGMSMVSYLSVLPDYEDEKVRVIGPSNTKEALMKYYDGELIWPVKATSDELEQPRLVGLDIDNLDTIKDKAMFKLGDTLVNTMQGNHPGGVLLYRFDSESEGKSLVYATDNEFDYLPDGKPNSEVEPLKKDYRQFIEKADLLVADAQFTKREYIDRGDFHGFGHSYMEQIVELASEANVKRLMLTHHGKFRDEFLTKREKQTQKYAEKLGSDLEVMLAKEGMEIVFE